MLPTIDGGDGLYVTKYYKSSFQSDYHMEERISSSKESDSLWSCTRIDKMEKPYHIVSVVAML